MHLLFLFFLVRPLVAAPLESLLSYEEFLSVSQVLSQKVSLFQAVWKIDPKAKFFGGTPRDFLYWVKGQITRARTREEALKTIQQLKDLKSISATQFITGDSDVDVIAQNLFGQLNPQEFGIKKIDLISPPRLDASTEEGRSERAQGFIPVEKILLTKEGIFPSAGMGNGAKEIYTGNLTVNYPDKDAFRETLYAKQGKNHEVLLALRYLRLLSLQYFYEQGQKHPEKQWFDQMDPQSAAQTKRAFQEAKEDPQLKTLLRSDYFQRKLNETIHKGFRAYTNRTATKLLHTFFGVDSLIRRFSQIRPTNQYLFAQAHDAEQIQKNLRAYEVDTKRFYLSATRVFPDGYLYHGTKDSDALAEIVTLGFLPSRDGNAGTGLYGVNLRNKKFAVSLGNKKHVVKVPVLPEASIVDMTKGEGQRVYASFMKQHPRASWEDFASAFGADILGYPHRPEAFVVKNGKVLGRPQADNLLYLFPEQLLEFAKTVKDEEGLKTLLKHLNYIPQSEKENFLKEAPYLNSLGKDVDSWQKLETYLNQIERITKEAGELKKKTTEILLRNVPFEPAAHLLARLENILEEKSTAEIILNVLHVASATHLNEKAKKTEKSTLKKINTLFDSLENLTESKGRDLLKEVPYLNSLGKDVDSWQKLETRLNLIERLSKKNIWLRKHLFEILLKNTPFEPVAQFLPRSEGLIEWNWHDHETSALLLRLASAAHQYTDAQGTGASVWRKSILESLLARRLLLMHNFHRTTTIEHMKFAFSPEDLRKVGPSLIKTVDIHLPHLPEQAQIFLLGKSFLISLSAPTFFFPLSLTQGEHTFSRYFLQGAGILLAGFWGRITYKEEAPVLGKQGWFARQRIDSLEVIRQFTLNSLDDPKKIPPTKPRSLLRASCERILGTLVDWKTRFSMP